jgi:ferritin
MLNPKIQDAFNQQLNAELYSSYLYLSMAAHFQWQNLPGMANWMRVQAQEELTHAMKFFDFINDRDGRVLLAPVEGPKTQWQNATDVFQDVYDHEQKVSGLIGGLADLAMAEKDHAAHAFLEWFVTEQVEEEAAAKLILDKLKLAGGSPVVLLMLDAELGQRVPAAPAASGAA